MSNYATQLLTTYILREARNYADDVHRSKLEFIQRFDEDVEHLTHDDFADCVNKSIELAIAYSRPIGTETEIFMNMVNTLTEKPLQAAWDYLRNVSLRRNPYSVQSLKYFFLIAINHARQQHWYNEEQGVN